MGIKRCFFWKQDDQIACVRYEGAEPVLIKPRGELFVSETSDYWNDWEDYSGFLPESDEIDFCLVYQNHFYLPEYLEVQMEVPKYRFWTAERVRECMKLLGISGAYEMKTPAGEAVMTIRMYGKAGLTQRIIRYRKNVEEMQAKEYSLEERELSPFTAYYLEQAEEKSKEKEHTGSSKK